MIIRVARKSDAVGMSVVLAEIIANWMSARRSDPEFVRDFYVTHPATIQCVVAEDADGSIVGFQHLRHATPGNVYGVKVGWGVIGTYVKLDAGRRGIGSKLFAKTLSAARQAGLEKIDATIAEDNMLGLKYYDAMGFETYRSTPNSTSKFFDVTATKS